LTGEHDEGALAHHRGREAEGGSSLKTGEDGAERHKYKILGMICIDTVGSGVVSGCGQGEECQWVGSCDIEHRLLQLVPAAF
jgi:hypothetical protein